MVVCEYMLVQFVVLVIFVVVFVFVIVWEFVVVVVFGGQCIVVVEFFGNGSSNCILCYGISGEDVYCELKIYYFNINVEVVCIGNVVKVDWLLVMVEGELEMVWICGDCNGILLVYKDLILSILCGDWEVMIFNLVVGYVQVNNDKWNFISIWSYLVGYLQCELVGQVLYGVCGIIFYKIGDFVEYGVLLICQFDVGILGVVYVYIEFEFDQYCRFLGDMFNDCIILGGKVYVQGFEVVQVVCRVQQVLMVDGVLKQGECGDEVKVLQGKLVVLGYVGVDGKLLYFDGVYGKDMFVVVKQFQVNNGLDDDGKVGCKILVQVDVFNVVKVGIVLVWVEFVVLVSMCDVGYVDNVCFDQVLGKLQVLEQQCVQVGLKLLFNNLQEVEWVVGQLVYESKVFGMCQIDYVVVCFDGIGLFVVQGELGDLVVQWIFVDCQQVVLYLVEVSSWQSEVLDSQFNLCVQEQQQEQVCYRGL